METKSNIDPNALYFLKYPVVDLPTIGQLLGLIHQRNVYMQEARRFPSDSAAHEQAFQSFVYLNETIKKLLAIA